MRHVYEKEEKRKETKRGEKGCQTVSKRVLNTKDGKERRWKRKEDEEDEDGKVREKENPAKRRKKNLVTKVDDVMETPWHKRHEGTKLSDLFLAVLQVKKSSTFVPSLSYVPASLPCINCSS